MIWMFWDFDVEKLCEILLSKKEVCESEFGIVCFIMMC